MTAQLVIETLVAPFRGLTLTVGAMVFGDPAVVQEALRGGSSGIP